MTIYILSLPLHYYPQQLFPNVISSFCDMNRLRGFICLNTRSPASGTVWENLDKCGLVEVGVALGGGQ